VNKLLWKIMYAGLKFELFAMLIFYYGMSLILPFSAGRHQVFGPLQCKTSSLIWQSLWIRLRCNKYGSIKFSTCVILAHILLPAPKGMMLKFLIPISNLSLFNIPLLRIGPYIWVIIDSEDVDQQHLCPITFDAHRDQLYLEFKPLTVALLRWGKLVFIHFISMWNSDIFFYARK